MIFYPPDCDQLIAEVIIRWARFVNIEGTTAEGGIQLCARLWQQFFHIGDIPTYEEVLSLYDPKRRCYLPKNFEFTARDDDDPEYRGDVPCTGGTVPATPALADIVWVRHWLMDTGSAMDLINERAAEPFAHYIEQGEEVRLATANGVIGSRRRLELHIEELTEDVTPLVLQNTPCVLSVGKRVVQDGYDFVWRHGEDPYLLHPEGRRRVDLVVRDFCPYLSVTGAEDPPPPRQRRRAAAKAAAAATPRPTWRCQRPRATWQRASDGVVREPDGLRRCNSTTIQSLQPR